MYVKLHTKLTIKCAAANQNWWKEKKNWLENGLEKNNRCSITDKTLKSFEIR